MLVPQPPETANVPNSSTVTGGDWVQNVINGYLAKTQIDNNLKWQKAILKQQTQAAAIEQAQNVNAQISDPSQWFTSAGVAGLPSASGNNMGMILFLAVSAAVALAAAFK